MALQTKTFTVGKVDDLEYNRFALDLILTEESVSEVMNTSEISYVLQLRSGSRSFSKYRLGAEIKLAGEVVAKRDQNDEPQMSIGTYSTLKILSGKKTILHSQDGSLNMAVEFWINTPEETYTPCHMEMTGASMKLTDIPRASTLRATSANIGEVSMLAITRHSPVFTHSVKYTFGSQQGYISATGEATQQEEIFDAVSLGFLLPESFYDEIPDDPSGICNLEITTYAGSTCIGTELAAFTATASPAICAPEATFFAGDVNADTLALTGDESTLIRGVSIVKCQVDARGQKGATVTSVLVNGKPDLEFIAVTNVLELVVTDSRGYVTRQTLALPMVDYVILTCNATSQRVDPTSGRVRLQVWGQYFDGGFGAGENGLSLTCRLPDGRQMDIPYTVFDNTYQGEVVLTDLSYQSAHTIEIAAMDALIQVHRVTTVNRGVPVFDWGQSDFAFHVPVIAEGGVNGVHMAAFSGPSLWLTPAGRPQSFLIAADGVLGVLTANSDSCTWQGTEGVTQVASENSVGLLFDGDTQGIILSNRNIG